MSRISLKALAQVITKVRAMDIKQKEQLADVIFRVQPHMLASVLVQKQMGVSLDEKELPAYVEAETANWLKRIVPEESDKYVMLAAANFANCIAFVPLNAPKSDPCPRQTG